MSLFTDVITHKFRKATRLLRRIQIKITNPVDPTREKIISKEYQIVNREGLLAHIKGEGTNPGSRSGSAKSAEAVQRALERSAEYQRKEYEVLTQLLAMNATMCQGQVNIGYTKGSTHRSIATATSDYDILAIIDQDPPASIIHADKTREINTIVGFIIAQRGECPKYPDAYVVNLICTRVSGISKLLLGGYLYAIKSQPHLLQLGILELAGAFGNLDGYCAYGGVGFVIDSDIFTPELEASLKQKKSKTQLIEKKPQNMIPCLNYSSDMLPMSVNLTQYTSKEAIIATLSKAKGAKIFGKTEICVLGITPDQKEKLRKLNQYLYVAIMLSNHEFRLNGWEFIKIPYALLINLSRIMNKETNIRDAIVDIADACTSIVNKTSDQRQTQQESVRVTATDITRINNAYKTLTPPVLKTIRGKILRLMDQVVKQSAPAVAAVPAAAAVAGPNSGILGKIQGLKRRVTSLLTSISANRSGSSRGNKRTKRSSSSGTHQITQHSRPGQRPRSSQSTQPMQLAP
jgi:hypothetical protein